MDKIITLRDWLEGGRGGRWRMIPDFNQNVTHIEVRSKNNHVHYRFDVEGIVDPMDDWLIAKILDTPLMKRDEEHCKKIIGE
jgi:hypothetical protein